MSFKRIALCLMGLVVLLGGCAQAGGEGLGLGSAPWQDGRTVRYQWLDETDSEIGTSVISYTREGDVWVIAQSDQISGLDQTFEVRVAADTLAPVSEQKQVKTADTEFELTTRYEGGKLEIKAVVNGEDRTASVDVPANALDNDQLLVSLEALPFAEGYKGEVVVVVAQNALKVPMEVTVQGQEEIEVPAGTFQAWRVEFKASQGIQTVWYKVDAPHTLVLYDNGATRMALVEGE
ncbi:MAG: DUF3108 domain-containing protein [Anaerolineales bacterium]|nr:DUF3108 domain-containing protein [Anaerolineales bacterium]